MSKVPTKKGASGTASATAPPSTHKTVVDAAETFTASADFLHLAELVPIVRKRFAVVDQFPDDAIFASLKTIVSRTSERERAKAAFASNLGQYIGHGDGDHQGAMQALLALLPPPRS